MIVSSNVSDVRTAQQFGALLTIPSGAIYVLSEIRSITLDTTTLLLIAGGTLQVEVAFYFVSKSTFRREEILTEWKYETPKRQFTQMAISQLTKQNLWQSPNQAATQQTSQTKKNTKPPKHSPQSIYG
jgi:hypothetical protein